jgi:hypothetical protein
MVRMPTLEEIAALRQALAEALQQNQSLTGEVRVLRTERDLLQEKLNKLTRRLFDAQSEASATPQKDLFFNEAEAEGSKGEPAVEESSDDDTVEVPSHKRCDPTLLRRTPQLVVRRHGGRRQCERELVLAATDLPSQRNRRLPIPRGASGCLAQGQDRR